MRSLIIIFIFTSLIINPLFAQTVTIDSLWFWEEANCDNLNFVHICYTLNGDTAGVGVQMSADHGVSWTVPLLTLFNTEGNLGANTPPGEHCFDWLMSDDLPNTEGCDFQFGLNYSYASTRRISTFSDFAEGDTTHVKILSPDPDGTDDGALWLPSGRDTIYILQVYPNSRCTNCMSTAIYSYMRDGSPPLNIKVFLITITQFNSLATTDSSVLPVAYIDESGVVHTAVNLRLDFFDVLVFGVADSYAGYDLTPASANVVRAFAMRGKGLLFTHDTIGCSPGYCMTNFCSLTDVSGLECYTSSSWVSFSEAIRVMTDSLAVLYTPFVIPATFPVVNSHWKGQVIVEGDFLYRGNASGGIPEDNKLYWHSYHNPAYNSFSSFFSYGHREYVPEEWEAKAMINSIYYSYHGGIGSGVYTSAPYFYPGGGFLGSMDYSLTLPDEAGFILEISVDTTGGASPTWTSWMEVTDLLPPILPQIYGLRYRIGMERSPGGDSPILHWLSFTTIHDEFTVSQVGCLDSRPPNIDLDCTIDTVLGYDTLSFSWLTTDRHPSDEPCSVSIFYCGEEEHHLVMMSDFDWVAPNVNCDDAVFRVAARDQFCNWNETFCEFTIAMGGTLYFALPDTVAHQGDILQLPLKYSVGQTIHTAGFSCIIDFNPAIMNIQEVIFTSGIMGSWEAASWDTGGGTLTLTGTGDFLRDDSLICAIEVMVLATALEGGFTELAFSDIEAEAMRLPLESRDGFLMVLYNPTGWLFDLVFRGLSYELTTTVTMGASTYGTDGYDEGLDIISIPVPPHTPVWFILIDPENPHITRLARDVRDVDDTPICWMVTTPKSPGYLTWDPELLPPGEFILNGLVDMRATDQYLYRSDEIIRICFDRPRPQDFYIHFFAGWNMVSFPVLPVCENLNEVFPTMVGDAYWYDPGARSYVPTSVAERGKSFWIFSSEEVTERIAGDPVTQYSLEVYEGWNMIGAVMDTLFFSDISFEPPAEFISPQYTYFPGGYVPATEMIPTFGYWCLCTGNSVIWVSVMR